MPTIKDFIESYGRFKQAGNKNPSFAKMNHYDFKQIIQGYLDAETVIPEVKVSICGIEIADRLLAERGIIEFLDEGFNIIKAIKIETQEAPDAGEQQSISATGGDCAASSGEGVREEPVNIVDEKKRPSRFRRNKN